jgi:hypothetical protein
MIQPAGLRRELKPAGRRISLPKKLVLAGMLLALILASGCSRFAPMEEIPVYTPVAPTMTPDPCGPETVGDDAEQIRLLLTAFQEVAAIADATPQQALISPVMRLEEVRHEMNLLALPACAQPLQAAINDYTAAILRYYTKMQNKTLVRDAGADLQNSAVYWETVTSEYETFLQNARLPFTPLPVLSEALKEETDTRATAVNENAQSVMVRENPSTTGKVLSNMGRGVMARVTGRSEDSQWLRVDVNGIYGWVNAGVVTLNVDVNDLPVIPSGG